MSISLIQSYRSAKKTKLLLGRVGTVIFSTEVVNCSREQTDFLPYCFLLVELDCCKKKIEIQGEAHVQFNPQDRVIVKIRKISRPEESNIINYGLKACKLA